MQTEIMLGTNLECLRPVSWSEYVQILLNWISVWWFKMLLFDIMIWQWSEIIFLIFCVVWVFWRSQIFTKKTLFIMMFFPIPAVLQFYFNWHFSYTTSILSQHLRRIFMKKTIQMPWRFCMPRAYYPTFDMWCFNTVGQRIAHPVTL